MMERPALNNPPETKIAATTPWWRNELFQTRLALAAFSLVALAGLACLAWVNFATPKVIISSQASPVATTSTPAISFPDVELEARAAVVYDINNRKILFAKNANAALPLASLTKLMTVLVSAEQVPVKTIVSVPNLGLDSNQTNDSLIAGEKWRLKDLIDFTLVSSSNEGARALALVAMSNNQNPELNFISAMNNRKQTLGLNDLRFYNETGLDESSNLAGAYGSALAIAKLNAYLVTHHPELISATKLSSIKLKTSDQITHLAVNTDKVVADLPGLLSSKTGYTLLAGGNLAIVFQAGLNRPIAVTVLGSSFDGRFSDTKKLVAATLTYLAEGGN